jgi:fatty-acyl-CoA synthase
MVRYDAMKKNPPKKQLALEEYIVGGSALPKSLIEGFEKILELREYKLGDDRNISFRYSFKITPKHTHLSENEN